MIIAGLTKDEARPYLRSICLQIYEGSLNWLARMVVHPLFSRYVEQLVNGMQRVGHLSQPESSDKECFQAQSQPQRDFSSYLQNYSVVTFADRTRCLLTTLNFIDSEMDGSFYMFLVCA